jgi:hypothetical protein
MTNFDLNAGHEYIRLAKEYFTKVDNGDPTLLDMFTVMHNSSFQNLALCMEKTR